MQLPLINREKTEILLYLGIKLIEVVHWVIVMILYLLVVGSVIN